MTLVLFAVISAAALSVAVVVMGQPPAAVVAAYVSAMSLQALSVFGVDKLLAKRSDRTGRVTRISERALLAAAWCGGGLGAWVGMAVFRHKTRKLAFRIMVPIATAVQIGVVAWLAVR